MAIAARSPAPPPPTRSTSWAAAVPSLTTKLLVHQHPPRHSSCLQMYVAVVELYTPGDDAAGVGVFCDNGDVSAITRSQRLRPRPPWPQCARPADHPFDDFVLHRRMWQTWRLPSWWTTPGPGGG